MRGVRNLKTASGRVTRAGTAPDARSYHLFMKVTCLEMERVRRSTERAAAVRRIQDIDQRLAEIDREKAALLEQLEARGDLGHYGVSSPLSAGRMRDGGFLIQYG